MLLVPVVIVFAAWQNKGENKNTNLTELGRENEEFR